MNHGIHGGETLGRGVLEKASDKVNRILVCLTENLVEWMWLDLRELVLHVVWVHRTNLVAGWGTENLDNLHQLVDSRLAREERLSQHQLGHNTSRGPNIDLGSVVGSSEDQLRRSVVSGANV